MERIHNELKTLAMEMVKRILSELQGIPSYISK